MKQYTVYFTEPVCHKYIGDKFNKELKRWEYDVECEDWKDIFTFYSLALAKKLIKANLDKYKGSCITKIWANLFTQPPCRIVRCPSRNTAMSLSRSSSLFALGFLCTIP